MPRVQLKPLATYPFTVDLVVRTTDLNYGGHLGNDRLLSLTHEARVAFLASCGWTELDCAGMSLILGDTAVVYQSEAFAGEKLVFGVAAGEPSSCGFRLFYRVTCAGDDRAVALIENGMVCFDYDQRKIAPLPEAVRRICTASSDPAEQPGR